MNRNSCSKKKSSGRGMNKTRGAFIIPVMLTNLWKERQRKKKEKGQNN